MCDHPSDQTPIQKLESRLAELAALARRAGLDMAAELEVIRATLKTNLGEEPS